MINDNNIIINSKIIHTYNIIYLLSTQVLCGKNSSKPRPIVKIPCKVFDDTNISGSLYEMFKLLINELLLINNQNNNIKLLSDLFLKGDINEKTKLFKLIESMLKEVNKYISI